MVIVGSTSLPGLLEHLICFQVGRDVLCGIVGTTIKTPMVVVLIKTNFPQKSQNRRNPLNESSFVFRGQVKPKLSQIKVGRLIFVFLEKASCAGIAKTSRVNVGL